LATQAPRPRQFWNRIPQAVQEQVVGLALQHPEQSACQLAWTFTDQEQYFISESSVYRILKRLGLVTSPVFQAISAQDHFEHPATRINELWQTDFTHFKVVGWGWYYLCTVLDDFSRYIIAWRLSDHMAATDVQETLNLALAATGVSHIQVEHRPRLLSDNGPSFVSQPLARYLKGYRLTHLRSAPYHPQTQGKIERYHRSMKNVVKLDTFFYPWELQQAIAAFVEFYNHQRYHESLNNLTPADVYLGRTQEVQEKRQAIKQLTFQQRRQQHFQVAFHSS
jgi:transposase InsO family protein